MITIRWQSSKSPIASDRNRNMDGFWLGVSQLLPNPTSVFHMDVLVPAFCAFFLCILDSLTHAHALSSLHKSIRIDHTMPATVRGFTRACSFDFSQVIVSEPVRGGSSHGSDQPPQPDVLVRPSMMDVLPSTTVRRPACRSLLA